MRARLAIFSAELKHEHREILLKEKPKAFLDLSSKGTVPLLLTKNNKLIEEIQSYKSLFLENQTSGSKNER